MRDARRQGGARDRRRIRHRAGDGPRVRARGRATGGLATSTPRGEETARAARALGATRSSCRCDVRAQRRRRRAGGARPWPPRPARLRREQRRHRGRAGADGEYPEETFARVIDVNLIGRLALPPRRAAAHAPRRRRRHRQHGVGRRPRRRRRAVGLRREQARRRRAHEGGGARVRQERHPRERRLSRRDRDADGRSAVARESRRCARRCSRMKPMGRLGRPRRWPRRSCGSARTRRRSRPATRSPSTAATSPSDRRGRRDEQPRNESCGTSSAPGRAATSTS